MMEMNTRDSAATTRRSHKPSPKSGEKIRPLAPPVAELVVILVTVSAKPIRYMGTATALYVPGYAPKEGNGPIAGHIMKLMLEAKQEVPQLVRINFII